MSPTHIRDTSSNTSSNTFVPVLKVDFNYRFIFFLLFTNYYWMINLMMTGRYGAREPLGLFHYHLWVFVQTHNHHEHCDTTAGEG